MAWPVLIYSVLLMALGLVGYSKGSAASLYAGTGLGLLLFLSSIAIFLQKKAGVYAALGITALLTIVCAIRYFLTAKGLQGAVAIASGAMLLYLLIQYRKRR